MASMGVHLLGCVLALFGWIGVTIVCALPMWRVTAFIGTNIVTAQIFWEGIWMSCVVESTGQMQCKVYDSMLALSPDMQAARVLAIFSILVGIAGILVAFISGKCTNFIAEERGKVKASIVAGVLLMVSGVLCLITVSWTAVIIVNDFYNPLLLDAQRRELGASLYLGWAAGLLLVVGGGLLCSSCPPKENCSRSVIYNPLSVEKSTLQPSMALQVLGITLSMIGFAGTIIICALPMWKVTAFIGTNIVVAQVFWEGLWMTCVYERIGQMQCKLYDALLDLDPSLQAARGLIVTTMALACLAFLIFLVGADCTNCLSNPRAKARIVVVSGITFMLSGLTAVVPVSWTADSIIRDFHNPIVHEALKREMGAALYVGWVTAGFLFVGGAVLCTSCPPERHNYSPRYTLTKTDTHSGYAIKNYV
ncbi:hypothetical protein Q8A67_018803 [Cirrhinus molitorella]|uniref:Claudin n=3 Tax=Labeonini TaxID=2743697 RepID=A0AA88TR38_9TELE|nr:hypothetical protein Q8A67_018803 [Cirrhinus molitorella]